MSLCHYMFKPKYGPEIINKVLECFCDHWLNWWDCGAEWSIAKLKGKEGWYELYANPDYESSISGFSETVFTDAEIPTEQLTDSMMVLLVEAGVAFKYEDADPDAGYVLEDVELTNVIAALADEDSHVFSAWDNRCYTMNVKTGECKHHDMTDLIFSLAEA